MIVEKKILLCLAIVWSSSDFVKVDAINVLGIVTSSSRSHSHYAGAIFKELAKSGHVVTVLSPYRQSPIVKHFYLEDAVIRKKGRYGDHLQPDGHDYQSDVLKQYYEGLERTKFIAENPSFQKLLTSDATPDVIIFDYDYNEALLGLADIFNCPVIVLNIGRLRGLIPRFLGLPYPLHNLMNFLQPSNGNVIETIKNLFSVILEQLYIDLFYKRQQENLCNEIFSQAVVPSSNCWHNSIAKVLITTLSGTPLLAPADIVDVTGAHIPPNDFFKYLFPERLDDFIHSADSGCIYVSFGADVNPLTLPKDKINTIFRVLYRRPEKVIWAWSGNTSAFGNSPDFYLDRWLPQNDILRQDNVKLFITSGGQLSLIEAIHHEVPIIGIPLTDEQSAALDDIQSQGLGIKLDLCNVSTSSLTWALGELLDNDRFHENLVSKSESIQDRPMPPMELIKFWLKHVHRHRHNIRNRQKTQFSISYYFLDVYMISLIILVTLVFSIVFIVKCLNEAIARVLAKRKLKLY